MARKFSELRSKMSPAAQAKAKAETDRMLAEMPLQELRRARELSQVRLGELMHIAQSEVSKIEKRTDLYLSTLRSYIEAMGGELEIVARFPDGAVRVKQLMTDEERDAVPA
jgi:hypothetical protein